MPINLSASTKSTEQSEYVYEKEQATCMQQLSIK